MTWLETALVKPVHVVKVILGSVRQLEVVSQSVGLLDCRVSPEGFDGSDDVRLETLTLLRVDKLLHAGGQSARTVWVLTETILQKQILSRFRVLRRIVTSVAPRLLSNA